MATTSGDAPACCAFSKYFAARSKSCIASSRLRGFNQVVGGDRRRFADAALGKGQADLLLGVVVLPVLHHQSRDGQAGIDAVGVRRFQRAREAVHRAFSIAQRQQRVAGVQQNCRLDFRLTARLPPHSAGSRRDCPGARRRAPCGA